jgi:hypothetical protein
MNLTTFLLKPKLFLTDSLFYAVITPIIAYFFVFFNQIIPYINYFYLISIIQKKPHHFSDAVFLKIQKQLR